MKIAFVIGAPVVYAGHGVVSQMKTWKRGLEDLGHQVFLVSPWEVYDWKSFDAVHFFMYSEYVGDFIEAVCPENNKIIFSPVLDPDYSLFAMKAISHWGYSRLKLSNRYYRMRKIAEKFSAVTVRSDFEAKYVEQGWNLPKSKIVKIPLSFNFFETNNSKRENYCFHASYLADDRKNVKRLIQAAKKYDIPLKLAGKLRNGEEEKKIFGWIGSSSNIEYLGFLSQEELLDNYRRAKVFALPSTNEGVGIVALDAAAMGCDVVITKLGGPKEYYNSMATEVNPYDVDEIGLAIQKNLTGFTQQPNLQKYICENYSLEVIAKKLVVMYESLSHA